MTRKNTRRCDRYMDHVMLPVRMHHAPCTMPKHGERPSDFGRLDSTLAPCVFAASSLTDYRVGAGHWPRPTMTNLFPRALAVVRGPTKNASITNSAARVPSDS